MSEANGQLPPGADPAAVRDEWVVAVTELVAQVEGWCKELEWATRRAPKRVKDDRELGPYDVPMLMIQYWDVRLLLEPVSRFGSRNDGQLELYVMPAYDDVAVVYRRGGDWFIWERPWRGRDVVEHPLTKETFRQMVEEFRTRHAEAG